MTRKTRRTRSPFSEALIEESDLAFSLYLAFINYRLEPGIFLGLRTRNDPIPPGEQAFLMACVKKSYMEGDTGVKIRNFAKEKPKN